MSPQDFEARVREFLEERIKEHKDKNGITVEFVVPGYPDPVTLAHTSTGSLAARRNYLIGALTVLVWEAASLHDCSEQVVKTVMTR